MYLIFQGILEAFEVLDMNNLRKFQLTFKWVIPLDGFYGVSMHSYIILLIKREAWKIIHYS